MMGKELPGKCLLEEGNSKLDVVHQKETGKDTEEQAI